MRRHWQYLKYVLRHKWFVFLACLEYRVPLWIAIFHDWDKFLPDEWFPYARTFYKPDGSKQYVESDEFAVAWMLHQHRNKHHWQYWLTAGATPLPKTNILVWDRGDAHIIIDGHPYPWSTEITHHGTISVREPMPDMYRREMLADWIGAGKAMGKPNTWEWYEANKDKMKLHPETRAWIEEQIAELKRYHDAYEKARGMGLF